MTRQHGYVLRWPALAAGSVVLLLAGGLGAYAVIRATRSDPDTRDARETVRTHPPDTVSPTSARLPDVLVPMTSDAAQRAGITVATASAGMVEETRRFPAIVQPNSYRRVAVTPLVSGRLTSVAADLGQSVARGAILAHIFSPELSQAETRYISLRAELDAHERELQRTEQLVEIGAASRQELERLHAEHASKLAEVETSRSTLSLLGVSNEAVAALVPGAHIDAEALVRAPIAGVVTERSANSGLNVDASTALFTISDLSTVWVVADVYEQDLARVRVGLPATITLAAFPEMALHGSVSYIDPQLEPQTRTARMRIEVPNADGRLRIGMIAGVAVTSTGTAPAVLVPKSAVQNVGDRTVVYLAAAGQSGGFVERQVRVGDASGRDEVAILEGVAPGDSVVDQGSFAIRAERERLGLRSPAADRAGVAPQRTTETTALMKVSVTERGFEPSTLTLPAGARVRLTFVRTTDQTCGTEITFPSLNIRRPLPLNQPVAIDITVPKSGSLGFECGMHMLKGAVVAQ